MEFKILLKALDMIAGGTIDETPPYRAAPREALMEYAAKIADEYRNKINGNQTHRD